jgi:hypothetical protein
MSMQFTRRQLLKSAEAVVLASFLLPKNVRKVLDADTVSTSNR